MLRVLLSPHAFDIAECVDGESVVSAASNLRRDVILLDGNLRGIDAVSVSAALRGTTGVDHVPIVVLSFTGHSGADGNVPPGDACLTKPVDMDDLLAAVNDLAGRKSQSIG
jgi:two-component system KDP operon response regulator KdpE